MLDTNHILVGQVGNSIIGYKVSPDHEQEVWQWMKDCPVITAQWTETVDQWNDFKSGKMKREVA